jgi:fermentation-respiration switch protein FrsA (DUF1100 family)
VPVPRWLITPLVAAAGRLLFDSDPAKMRPIKVIEGLAPRPVLFIHGEEDRVVPSEDSVALYQRYFNPYNELWIVPRAGHVRCYAVARREYVERVASFFKAHMG